MVSMKESVSKMVLWAQTAITETRIEIEETTTSSPAIHCRCRSLPGSNSVVVPSLSVVN
jgi:hypothetical protein